MSDEVVNDWIIVFFVVGWVSVVSSLLTLVSVQRYGLQSCSSRLIFYLHVSQVVEAISSFPNFYYTTLSCTFASFFRSYFNIVQILVSLLMNLLASKMLFSNSTNGDILDRFTLDSRLEVLAFVLPMFEVLHFYLLNKLPYKDVSSYEFCVGILGGSNESLVLAGYLMYYIPIWLVLICNTGIQIHIMYRIYISKIDRMIINKALKGLGAYSIVLYVSWIPKTVLHFVFEYRRIKGNSKKEFLIAYFLVVYIAGILYALIYYFGEKKSLEAFDKYYNEKVEEVRKLDRINANSTAKLECGGSDAFVSDDDDEDELSLDDVHRQSSIMTMNSKRIGSSGRRKSLSRSSVAFNSNRESCESFQICNGSSISSTATFNEMIKASISQKSTDDFFTSPTDVNLKMISLTIDSAADNNDGI